MHYKFFMLSVMAILILTILSACDNNPYAIQPDTAKELLATDDSVILLDVRTKTEYDTEHIPGSILIPLAQLENDIENIITDKTTTIIIYCRSGNRSLEAIDILENLNYTNLYDLGGILDWPYDIHVCNGDC